MHILTRNVSVPSLVLEISQERYVALRDARAVLKVAFELEERYEVVVDNFFEFEKALLVGSLHHTLRTTIHYADVFEATTEINIRLMNFLASVRLYVDRLERDVRDISGDLESGKLAKASLSNAYDSHFEYAFMEALRNYAQHHGMPVHLTHPDGVWTSHADDAEREYTFDPFAVKEVIAHWDGFKATVLSRMPERVNLRLAARRYMECLSNVHVEARNSTANTVEAERALFDATIAEYQDASKEGSLGLTAYEVVDGVRTGSFSVFVEWDDVRRMLVQRNSQLVNLHRTFVSGRVRYAD